MNTLFDYNNLHMKLQSIFKMQLNIVIDYPTANYLNIFRFLILLNLL